MISISSPTFDYFGNVNSQRGYAKKGNLSRRSKRIPTLDGGVVVLDGGFSAGDISYVIDLPDVLGGHYEALSDMLAIHSSAILSCYDGCYLVVLSSLVLDGLNTRINADVIQEM